MRQHRYHTVAQLLDGDRFSAGSCRELVRGIRKSTHVPAMVHEFCLCVFTSSTHGKMQWIKVIWPRVSLFCTGCLLIPMIHIFKSTGRITYLIQNYNQ